MASKNEQRWQENYKAMKAYIEEHHFLPDKKKPQNYRLVNWWKYNKKLIKRNKIDPERARLLKELSDMRWI